MIFRGESDLQPVVWLAAFCVPGFHSGGNEALSNLG